MFSMQSRPSLLHIAVASALAGVARDCPKIGQSRDCPDFGQWPEMGQ